MLTRRDETVAAIHELLFVLLDLEGSQINPAIAS
jgi:hypothetical protein